MVKLQQNDIIDNDDWELAWDKLEQELEILTIEFELLND